jgi:hypothetical protein
VNEWEDVERAEARLEQRSEERGRRRRRRRRWATAVRWLATLVLPVAGSAVFTAIVERRGGDLGGYSDAQAVGVVLAVALPPALIVAWLWRRHGAVVAIGAALAVLLAEVALTLGVAFVALGYGP